MGRQPGADGGDRVGRSQKERPTPREGETHRTWGVSGVKKRGGIYSNGGLCEIKAQPGKKDMETRDKNKGFSEGGELDQGMGWGGGIWAATRIFSSSTPPSKRKLLAVSGYTEPPLKLQVDTGAVNNLTPKCLKPGGVKHTKS